MEIIKSINNESNPKRSLGDIKAVVCHHTGSTGSDEANKKYLNKDDYISAHYMVGKDGKIYQLMDLDRIAYHAGVSEWKGLKTKGNSLNWCTVGIEINSDGQTFTNAQRRATKTLIIKLMEDYNIEPELVLRHKDIAPGRKVDVGMNFYNNQFDSWEEYQKNLRATMEAIKYNKDSWVLAKNNNISEIMIMTSQSAKIIRENL